MSIFKAFRVFETEKNKFERKIVELDTNDLPDNDVLIKVKYSGLNYKDALSARGHKGITRTYPHTPGIDAVGFVESDRSGQFKEGDEVMVTGYDLGMNTDGGFGEYIKVHADWIVSLPSGVSMKESMIYGTGGFTAGISIHELQKHDVTQEKGKVLVTGATGAVGSMAVGMLSKAGYDVTAVTGKEDKHDYLKHLGANEIISREDVNDTSGKPLLSGKYAGAIDNVGGNTLSTVFKSIQPRGAVAVVGLVESDKLETFIYPFILRGITMIGIDSAERPMDYRLNIWHRIFNEWRIENPQSIMKEINMEDLESELFKMLEGKQYGRVVLKHN